MKMSMLEHERVLTVSADNHQEMDKPDTTVLCSSSAKSIDDLPPEILTIILELLTCGTKRNTMLGYRLVNSQWKNILDSIIEKKIVSSQFPKAFPKKEFEGFKDHFIVRVSPSWFPDKVNPFPFNSLQLCRTTDDQIKPFRFPMMSLTAFTLKYGENLTTFALHHELNLIPSSLIALLGSMPKLKRLQFQNVMLVCTVSELAAGLPNPPPLPFLETLEVNQARMQIGIEIMNIWLTTSYANQLKRLELLTTHQLPPLRSSHLYTHSIPSGDTTYSISTTSESAFRNLKMLKVLHPSREFFTMSATPSLQMLSVQKYLPVNTHYDLRDVLIFIDKCSSTLKTLSLNMEWKHLVSQRLMENYLDAGQPLEIEGKAVAVKILKIPFPHEFFPEIVLQNFLLKFPALEVLQFIRLNTFELEQSLYIVPASFQSETVECGIVNNQKKAEIDALKERLPPLFQQLATDRQNEYAAELALSRLKRRLRDVIANGFEEEIDAAKGQIRQLKREMKRYRHAGKAIQNERVTIFKELIALGEHVPKFMAQQMVKRGGFWNTLPNLRIISVSYGQHTNGSVCVFRREEQC